MFLGHQMPFKEKKKDFHFYLILSSSANKSVLEQKKPGWGAARCWGRSRSMAHPSWGGLKWDGWESEKTMWWESFWQRNWTPFERQIKVFFPLTVVYYLWPLSHFPLFLLHSGHTSISRVLSKYSQDINLPYVSVPCLPFGGKGLLLNHLMLKQWTTIFSPA